MLVPWSVKRKIWVTAQLISWIMFVTPCKSAIYGIINFLICWIRDWQQNFDNLGFLWRRK